MRGRPPSRDQIEGELAQLFTALASSNPEVAVTDSTELDLLIKLAPVMNRLRYDEANPSLDELAALVDLSTFQFVRSVRRVTGLAPLAWRQNARIGEARRMLRAGRSIADTAYTLGFTDQSHFHRVFRAHVAASPGTYRG